MCKQFFIPISRVFVLIVGELTVGVKLLLNVNKLTYFILSIGLYLYTEDYLMII